MGTKKRVMDYDGKRTEIEALDPERYIGPAEVEAQEELVRREYERLQGERMFAQPFDADVGAATVAIFAQGVYALQSIAISLKILSDATQKDKAHG